MINFFGLSAFLLLFLSYLSPLVFSSHILSIYKLFNMKQDEILLNKKKTGKIKGAHVLSWL